MFKRKIHMKERKFNKKKKDKAEFKYGEIK